MRNSIFILWTKFQIQRTLKKRVIICMILELLLLIVLIIAGFLLLYKFYRSNGSFTATYLNLKTEENVSSTTSKWIIVYIVALFVLLFATLAGLWVIFSKKKRKVIVFRIYAALFFFFFFFNFVFFSQVFIVISSPRLFIEECFVYNVTNRHGGYNQMGMLSCLSTISEFTDTVSQKNLNCTYESPPPDGSNPNCLNLSIITPEVDQTLQAISYNQSRVQLYQQLGYGLGGFVIPFICMAPCLYFVTLLSNKMASKRRIDRDAINIETSPFGGNQPTQRREPKPEER